MAASRDIDLLLKLEWAAVSVAALAAYRWLDGGWSLFLLLALAPDLSMLGYLAGPRAGAVSYNVFHTLLGPALLAAIGLATDAEIMPRIAAVWAAHIAFDRMLGYGLKLPTGFSDTHLGRLGRQKVP